MIQGNRLSLVVLGVSLVVVMLGFGIVMPIFPFLIEQMGGSGNDLGLLIAVYSVVQLVLAPIWGAASDQLGRKPVLLVGMVGNTAALVLFGLADSIAMLYVARILAGALSSATLPAAMAYVGDCTDEEDRAEGIGRLGGALALGVILGPGVGGWLAGDSLVRPFFIAAALSLVSTVLIVALLPESLPARHGPTAFTRPDVLRFRSLRQALASPIGFLLVLAFLVAFGSMNFQAIFGLYALHKFGMGPAQVGTVLVVVGLVSAAIQGALTGPASRRFGEDTVVKASLATNALGFLVLLLADTYRDALVVTAVYVMSHALLRPSVQALTSERAVGGQGAAMGLNSAFMSLGQIAGPICAGFLFDVNIHFPYLTGAVVMLLGFAASMRWLQRERAPQPSATLGSPHGAA